MAVGLTPFMQGLLRIHGIAPPDREKLTHYSGDAMGWGRAWEIRWLLKALSTGTSIARWMRQPKKALAAVLITIIRSVGMGITFQITKNTGMKRACVR